MAVPSNSIASMAQHFGKMAIPNTSEKALLIRIGTLIDALIQTQRGLSNVGAVTRRKFENRANVAVTGTAANVFGAAQVCITPTDSDNLSHYEIQYDTDSNYSAPTSIDTFGTEVNIKGLTAGTTYSLRVRPVNKIGEVGAWTNLGDVAIAAPPEAIDGDGNAFLSNAESKSFAFPDTDQQLSAVCGTPIRFFDAPISGSPLYHPGEFDIDFRSRDADDNLLEEISFPGHTQNSVGLTVIHNKAVIFFTLLINQDDPESYKFKLQQGDQNQTSELNITEPCTWVKF